MDIIVNGKAVTVGTGLSILGVLNHLQIAPQHVAVEYDGRILIPDDFAVTTVQPGSRLEIVRFVGGG